MPIKPPKSIEIFCSFSPDDKILFSQLELHLQLLKKRGQIDDWHTSKTSFEKNQVLEFDSHLNTANILLLLISASSFASDYHYNEMLRAFERHQAGEARVVPIILRPSDWLHSPLGRLYELPKGGKPISMWKNSDNAISDVVRGIQIVIKELWWSPP